MTTLLDEVFPANANQLWPSALPDHLSASQVGMAQRCFEQYRRRYILGEKERPGAALIWGAADHFAHEQNFVQKIESHEDIPVADVQAAFAEGFDQRVEQNGGEAEIVWGDDKPGALKDAGTALVAVYHEQVSPSVQPVAVERKFSLDIPGVPVPVIGYVDVETAGPAIERKTAKQRPPNGEIKSDWRIQGLLYQSVVQRQVDWHVSLKQKLPGVLTPTDAPGLSLPFVPARAQAGAELVRSMARTLVALLLEFGPDEPWPGALSHPWACSWCAWKPSCHWWGNS